MPPRRKDPRASGQPRSHSTAPPHSRSRSTPAPFAHPSSLPPDRVSHTKVMMRDEAPSAVSEVQLRELPDGPIDRLLVAVTGLPYDEGEAVTVQALVDAVGAILPAHAVGACLVGSAVPGASGDADAGSQRPHQRVFQHVPSGDRGRVAGMDPTRLFPGYAYERVFDLGGPVPHALGSTLHLATDDPSLEDDGSPAVHVAHRAAAALGHALDQACAHSAARRAQRDLRALESQIIQADKLASFGQIAAGLVHELNNPLTSIVAYTDYLIRKALARTDAIDPDDMERLRRISESANRMLRFTRDLVTYARPSSEVAVPVVLHGVIDQALAFCEHVVAEAGATIDRRYGAGVLTVRGMPERLTQVFVNLVTNACHAVAPSGGSIVVATEAIGGGRRVRIVIEDTGHGIAPEHIEQVFAPFFTTKGQGRGTGLGLSIVRNIIEAHGGSICVESVVPGGTKFTIELPAGR